MEKIIKIQFNRRLVILGVISLTGCGLSTFTQRETDPFIRDIVGNAGKPIAIMVTDSSRRLVYEFNNSKTPNSGPIFCADAPPDTSIAASGAIGGNVTATIPTGTPNENGTGALEGYRTSSTSTLPLVRRSQGLQWGRDQAANECLLFAMGITKKEEYLKRLETIRETSKGIIEKEIEKGLGDLQLGSKNDAPVAPTPKKEK